MKKKFNMMSLAVMSALGISAAFMSTANAANEPTYASATVDGYTSEWNLTTDLFSKMCEAGRIDHSTGNCTKDHLSNLYLRYDCSTNTMYALVLREGNYWPEKEADESWIKAYQLGQNPVAGGDPIPSGSQFSWVAPNGIEGVDLIGYEVSFPLIPDPYDIEAHINIDSDRTSSTGKKNDPLELSLQCNPVSNIDIETHTNDIDADDPTGPVIAVGNGVNWSYIVTNNGYTDLTGIAVTDDVVGSISCPKTSLVVGESMICTATGTATANQYANVGSVTATDPDGDSVNDTDPSHYFGGVSNIDIEYLTKSGPGVNDYADADGPSGPIILTGETVTWKYEVTNIGNVALQNIVVTDNILGTISCPSTSLAVGASMICTATGTATAYQYSNTASVTADYSGTPVSDTDKSHYYGADPSIDLEKFTNGEDADTITGPMITADDPVFWMYRVENTGNTDLTNVQVTDSVIASANIDCGEANNDNVISILHMGETKTCKANGISTAGQYDNLGTATTTYTDDLANQRAVSDTDYSHYLGDARPYCAITAVGTNANGDKYIEVTTSDTDSGISEILVTREENVNITGHTGFTVGITVPILITATKVDQNLSSVVEFQITDLVGNVTVCDPVISVVARTNGKPVTQTFTDIPEIESKITVTNGAPGLKEIQINVNGQIFVFDNLADNQVIFQDVAAYMNLYNNNTISLTALGKPDGSALVLIADM
ncbi:DUF7507 domain-containing protein [Candidatus Marithrix sp. Canyon 246]|uniref:DUF7507 domain-containing protein n=1 Tax=Candidatus Marithrix sp. Canyon 246 TaxID=1827136 RepID=UPI00084A2666|nr:hypothetical protein [Candidatus Marithrix sp. Canyon 246]